MKIMIARFENIIYVYYSLILDTVISTIYYSFLNNFIGFDFH